MFSWHTGCRLLAAELAPSPRFFHRDNVTRARHHGSCNNSVTRAHDGCTGRLFLLRAPSPTLPFLLLSVGEFSSPGLLWYFLSHYLGGDLSCEQVHLASDHKNCSPPPPLERLSSLTTCDEFLAVNGRALRRIDRTHDPYQTTTASEYSFRKYTRR